MSNKRVGKSKKLEVSEELEEAEHQHEDEDDGNGDINEGVDDDSSPQYRGGQNIPQNSGDEQDEEDQNTQVQLKQGDRSVKSGQRA